MSIPSEKRQARIMQLAALPGAVEAVVESLDGTQLDTPYRQGGWTVRQVVHHLADAHLHGYARMRWVLTEDRPTLKTYDQDAWADLPDAAQAPVDTSLAILRGVHGRWIALLLDLPEAAWARTAHHPEKGEVTMDDLLETYAHHGMHHVDQIRTLRTQRGW